jgi:hypothetical protein
VIWDSVWYRLVWYRLVWIDWFGTVFGGNWFGKFCGMKGMDGPGSV